MELFFLVVLVLLMVTALTSGFPVAFSLPGSAILSIALAAFCGYVFEGDADAYFAQDGALQWLSAGVTNFRSLYWNVERDTLIAIPLFVFMGIMLQRSKIAEDLLVSMAQLFGPVPGGLGISVVFVGALLAATTGIVGATVIAMGLISLPAMLRHNYSKSLATGTICASGTLGQIIPPSIVLIILADQLSSASDQASTTRKADYKAATGEFSLPAEFDITSASAGDMFMGALLPGLVLVGVYMVYILISAWLKPGSAPPVPYDGQYDRKFAAKVFLSLIPPLTLIFVVLGSIISGVATVNQAGAIGAIGAMIMGSYRLSAGQRGAYGPAVLAVVSTASILIVLHFFTLNVKSIKDTQDVIGITLAGVAVTGLTIAILWSTLRAYRIDSTLEGVMIETAKTTSMVFIILIGAAMLTSAFRAFGGEALVREFLTSLPGGFWTQFIVVMAVIFFLGFFLDFIEIAVVVVPIVAPILLADPSANITAVWLGVMVGLNIQTSFLTPPFGFALFYLRGVAPPSVKTTDIYRGAAAFILLQLAGLVIVGAFPSLVNYLPYRTYLTSETAPPPQNPRLQYCLEEYLFDYYDNHADPLRRSIMTVSALDLSVLPTSQQDEMSKSFSKALATFELVDDVRKTNALVLAYAPEYRPLHHQVRGLQAAMRDIDGKLKETKKRQTLVSRSNNPQAAEVQALIARMSDLAEQKSRLASQIPQTWKQANERYTKLAKAEKSARSKYRRNADESYLALASVRTMITEVGELKGLSSVLGGLDGLLVTASTEEVSLAVKVAEKSFNRLSGVDHIKAALAEMRNALKGNSPQPDVASTALATARSQFAKEVAWRESAGRTLLADLDAYDALARDSIGVRLQARLNDEQADAVATCQAIHRDVSLNF